LSDRPTLLKVAPYYSRSGEIFGILTVTLSLLSLHLSGLLTFTIDGDIDISPADVTTIFLGYIWLIYALRARLCITKSLLTAVTLASLFTIWVGIEAFQSPEPVRGFTMFLLMLRNVAILWLIGSMLGSIRDLQRLNKAVFLVGIAVAILSLALYLFAARDYHDILTNPTRWKPDIIYVLGQAGVLRLKGFAGDPNFYSLWMSVSLFCGLTVSKIRRLWKWLGITVIITSILLALSRGFFVALGASSLLIALWLTLFHAKISWRKYAKPIIVGSIFISLIALMPLSHIQRSPAQLLINRFQLTATTPRFGMWKEILSDLPSHLLLGAGLRSAEWTLGGMYSHNSYMDLLFETGLIGFILWAFFGVFILKQGLSRINVEFLPWIHSWLVIILMFLFFSSLYNPFLWIIAGVITAFPESTCIKAKNDIRADRFSD